MATAAIDWAAALDLPRALANCHIDSIGDWYRDPWGWADVDWVVERAPELLVARLNGLGAKRSIRLDVPKENFGVRPALVMDPLDRLVYQALVDRCSADLLSGLKPWAFMARLERKNPAPGVYSDGGDENELYRSYLTASAARFQMLLTTDVVSFFASIQIERLIDVLAARTRQTAIVERLSSLILHWDEMPTHGGLPQRFLPSSVLANLYLRPLDDVLTTFSGRRARRFPHYRVARWVDDIWAFGDDEPSLRRAQLDLADIMRSLGLNMNVAKTKLLEGDEAESEVQQREHSAVDGALSPPQTDFGPLNNLIDEIMTKPESADRTRIRFATRRMRRHDAFDRVQDFVDAAPRMPHAADILARLFRDSEVWRDLGTWYTDYAASEWALEWSVGQLGTMFPSGQRPPGGVRDFMAAQLEPSRSLVFTAVAAQRLAAWDADTARTTIREAAESADHPLRRRVLALAAFTADEERVWVRELLSEFEENVPTREMLKRPRTLRTAADFSGD